MSEQCTVQENSARIISMAFVINEVQAVDVTTLGDRVILGYVLDASDRARVSDEAAVSDSPVIVSMARIAASANHSVASIVTAGSRARVRDTFLFSSSVLAVEQARASDALVMEQPAVVITDRARASASEVLQAIVSLSHESARRISDAAFVFKDLTLTDTLRAADRDFVLRTVLVDEASRGLITASDDFSTQRPDDLLVSLATLRSSADTILNGTLTVDSRAQWSDRVLMRDPSTQHLVLGTESTAVSTWTGCDFESLAQVGEDVLATGPDGLYILDADDDDGTPINARVDFASVGFGISQTKRIDNLYIGYSAEGRLRLSLSVQESGGVPAVFPLERRPADTPRVTRVTPGKGMVGRYWRMSLQNEDGAAFWINDAEVDLAVSSRRI